MNRVPWLIAMLGCLLVTAGCAKRVPSTDMKFEAQQKVVLKLRGGEELEGRMERGNRVELREPGAVWSAHVGEVTDERIVLKDLVRLRDAEGVALQVARAKDARLDVAEGMPEKAILRTEIVGVDLLKTDSGKTARNATFWTFSAAILTILLGEKS
jgi:hypothetical protein